MPGRWCRCCRAGGAGVDGCRRDRLGNRRRLGGERLRFGGQRAGVHERAAPSGGLGRVGVEGGAAHCKGAEIDLPNLSGPPSVASGRVEGRHDGRSMLRREDERVGRHRGGRGSGHAVAATQGGHAAGAVRRGHAAAGGCAGGGECGCRQMRRGRCSPRPAIAPRPHPAPRRSGARPSRSPRRARAVRRQPAPRRCGAVVRPPVPHWRLGAIARAGRLRGSTDRSCCHCRRGWPHRSHRHCAVGPARRAPGRPHLRRDACRQRPRSSRCGGSRIRCCVRWCRPAAGRRPPPRGSRRRACVRPGRRRRACWSACSTVGAATWPGRLRRLQQPALGLLEGHAAHVAGQALFGEALAAAIGVHDLGTLVAELDRDDVRFGHAKQFAGHRGRLAGVVAARGPRRRRRH